ncbi:MAG TPA: sensor histidine kinase [Parafilimonas sp.]|nr:sensor histidine kinase [Parafilimonas sp.]
MRVTFVIIISLFTSGIFSQVQHRGLEQLLVQYKQSRYDTSRIKILLSIDTLYALDVNDNFVMLDTIVLLTKQIKQLSSALHFQQGAEDADYLLAKAYIRKKNVPAALTIMKNIDADNKVHLFIDIGEHYTFQPGQLKENLDSAYPYIIKAMQLSNAIKSQYWKHKSFGLLGKYYFTRGELRKGIDCFLKVIHEFQESGDLNNEAFWWEELGIYMPDSDSSYADEINAYQNARRLLQETGNIQELESVAGNLGFVYQLHGQLDSAEKLYLQKIEVKKQLKQTDLSDTYNYLVELSMSQGNYNSSVYYSMQAIRYLDSSNFRGSAGVIYFNLAEAYRELGETEKSLQWFKKSLDNLVTQRAEYLFAVARKISGALISENKPGEALGFLNDFSAHNKPPRYSDKEMLAAAFGDCFYALKQFDKAEKYYLQMMAVDSLARAQRSKEIFSGQHGSILNSADANFIIGKFYLERQRYAVAQPYLKKALVKDIFEPSLLQLRDVHFALFKVDSAQKDYANAIKEFAIAKALNDSVFNIAKNKQIQQLQVEYDVAQRQKQLQVLQANQKVQDKELQRSHQARNYTYAIVAILLILFGIGYSRYRLKQQTNKQLEAQQQEIHNKNKMLENLVQEKDGLIKDKDDLLEQKEWLVKEIHHRVKNNLQIVISLLSTQSKYLNNEEAIQAISESRHRMQAMSLIHQKLYQSENTTSVNMQTYITELADYLKASFDSGKEINFQTEVDAIELDLSQAIPLGLILNELITNSIKYAFNNREAGSIHIKMICDDEKNILLEIKDNGVGLPGEIDFSKSSSMGMRLVNGLAKQLNGVLIINGNNGVCVQLKFMADTNLKYTDNQQAEETATHV